MTNYTRKYQKVFASGAVNNGQFGSLQAATKVKSTDPEVLQALAAYEAGWNSAVISGEQLPSLEEFQGLQYKTDYQLAYVLQKGFPEWNTDTTYYIGDLTREVGGSKIYKSLTDTNSGNVLTDAVNWQFVTDFSIATTTNQGVSYLPKQITISNGTDTDHDIDFTAGNFQFDDGSGQAVLGALTKQFDATFALGTAAGGMVSGESLPTSGAVYLYQISNADGSLADIIGTTTKDGSTISGDSVVSANSLTKKKYLGAFVTDSSDNIRNGKWVFDSSGSYKFTHVGGITDLGTTTPSLTRVAFTMSAPANSEVRFIGTYVDNETTDSGIIFTEEGQTDLAPTQNNSDLWSDFNYISKSEFTRQLNSSSQLYYRADDGGVSGFVVFTLGWKEYL